VESTFEHALDEFYGEGYLDDSDSDSEADLNFSSEDESERISREEVERLSVEEKFEFRARQRETFRKMITKEARPKILLSLLDSGLGIKVVDQMKLFKLFGRLKSS